MSIGDEQLAASPLLVGLTDDELQTLLEAAESRCHEDGELIVREGTPSDCLFLLESGTVQVERVKGGRRVVLARLAECGDFFGEMSLIDILPHSADIRAVEGGVTVRAFAKQQLTGLFGRSPRVQMTMILNIARNLSLRLRQADSRIVELTT